VLDIYVLIRIFDFFFSIILVLICLAFERQTRHFTVDFPIHTRTKALFFKTHFQKDTTKFSVSILAAFHSIYISSHLQKIPFFSFLQLLESRCIVLIVCNKNVCAPYVEILLLYFSIFMFLLSIITAFHFFHSSSQIICLIKVFILLYHHFYMERKIPSS
jgi:hypothetical protein